MVIMLIVIAVIPLSFLANAQYTPNYSQLHTNCLAPLNLLKIILLLVTLKSNCYFSPE